MNSLEVRLAEFIPLRHQYQPVRIFQSLVALPAVGDVANVRLAIGADSRIGHPFLFPGIGYGGSCFPKDIRALMRTARDAGMATVRIRHRHDDASDLPEADAVADTHAHLLEILGVG